jgi:GT2 family glycosyltransferase
LHSSRGRSAGGRAVALFWGGVGTIWLTLLGIYAATVASSHLLETTAIVLIGAASSAIWLNGVRHLAMWATARFWFRPAGTSPVAASSSPSRRVALLYCTADDFDPTALHSSMAQQHPVTTVILDDSARDELRSAIDAFAIENGAEVIRRSTRSGFKAGNLNHGIELLLGRFDYFVVLDSDEVLPPHFVHRALQGFADHRRTGIVQARHRASPSRTAFATTFAGILGTHIGISQAARARIGFSSFLGHGAMISSACYRAAGPIPETVAEDLAFSFEARIAGYRIAYDHDLVCEEDYPVDYHAFRTQHTKIVEGTTEFLRNYWRRIIRSRLSVAEKLDLLLEQLTFPLLATAGAVLMLANLLLAALGGTADQPLWAIAVTGLCAAAPLLPETVRVVRQRGLVAGGTFLAMASALYGSTLIVTLRATAKVIFGGAAVFRVTPKTERRAGRWGTLVALWLELAVTVAAVWVALALTGSLIPALPVAGAAIAALAFASFGALPARRAARVRTARLAPR